MRSERSKREIHEAVFTHYGTTCACCGSPRQLSIDHVDTSGRAHRQALFGHQYGGIVFYRWLVKNGFPDGFQTLCNPCNSSKDTGDRCRLWHGDPAYGRCTKCQQVLPVEEFYRTRQFLSGHRPDCKACFSTNRPRPDDLLAALRHGQAAGAATKRARARAQRLPKLLAAVASRIEAGEPVIQSAIWHLDGYWSAVRTLQLSHRQIVELAQEIALKRNGIAEER